MMDLLKQLQRTRNSIEREKKELSSSFGNTRFSVKKMKGASKVRKGRAKMAAKKSSNHHPSKKVHAHHSATDHDLLKDALSDLNKELKVLRSAKARLEHQIEELDRSSMFTQNKEIRLRNEISELMKKATLLTKKKSSIKDTMLLVSKKIDKVVSVSRQLKE